MASALKKFRMLEQQQEEDPAPREPEPKPAKKNKLSMYSHIFSNFESSDSPDEMRRKTIEKVREEKRQAEVRKKEKLEEEKRRREEEAELKRKAKEEEERRRREEEEERIRQEEKRWVLLFIHAGFLLLSKSHFSVLGFKLNWFHPTVGRQRFLRTAVSIIY